MVAPVGEAQSAPVLPAAKTEGQKKAAGEKAAPAPIQLPKADVLSTIAHVKLMLEPEKSGNDGKSEQINQAEIPSAQRNESVGIAVDRSLPPEMQAGYEALNAVLTQPEHSKTYGSAELDSLAQERRVQGMADTIFSSLILFFLQQSTECFCANTWQIMLMKYEIIFNKPIITGLLEKGSLTAQK
jgi:hypothetical protein